MMVTDTVKLHLTSDVVKDWHRKKVNPDKEERDSSSFNCLHKFSGN